MNGELGPTPSRVILSSKMPVWTHPPWVLFKLNYPANLNTQATWGISKFIGGSSAIVDVDFIFGALKQGINSSRVTCPQAASERNQKSDVGTESGRRWFGFKTFKT